MASVRQKDRGWLMIYATTAADGTRRQHSKMFNGTSKRAAIAEARRLEAQARGLDADANGKILRGYFAQWLEATATKVSARTLERYTSLLATVSKRIGVTPLAEVTALQLERLYGDLLKNGRADGGPLSPRTVRHIHAVMRKAFRDGVRWRVMSAAPTDGARPPSVPRTVRPAADGDHLQQLLAAVSDPDLRCIIETAALTGMRRQEILALEWSDLDLDGARIVISRAVEETAAKITVKATKSRAGERTIHLPERAVAGLRAHRARQGELRLKLGADWYCGDLVFPSYDTGTVRRPRNVTKAVARIAGRIGLTGYGLHSLRHGHATQLLLAGVSPKVVQERLGHSTIATTMDIYSHVLPSMDRDAADKIERAFAPAIKPGT